MSFNPNWGNPNQFQPMSPGDRQMAYAQHVGTLQAQEYYRRRRASRAEKAQRASSCGYCHMPMRAGNAYCTNCAGYAQPLPSARRGVGRPASAKKRTAIIIFLIAVAVLTLGAVLQAHSTSATPNGTPGVISVGANIRTGPGTENSIAATAPAGTRIVIACRIRTPAGKWDELAPPYRGLYVSATLVHSHRPPRC
jgi:hypothetical protein